MVIHLKKGIDSLLFGMQPKDVEAIYGKPNRTFIDEDKNQIYLYHSHKWRLTFYEEEQFKLGYIITSNPDVTLHNHTLIGKKVQDVISTLEIKEWEEEDFDSTTNYFNETNWLIFQTEYDEILRVELGAIINDKDEFDWKFGK